MPHQEARRRGAWGAAAFACAAAVPAIGLRGFTVDDALISARVAAHIADGAGHRFNMGGSVVDAVTPLGWAYVLSLGAGGGPLAALHFARWIGSLAWLLAVAWLGFRIAERERPRGWLPLLPVIGTCAPLAVWAVSGMETGVVVALATVALGRGRLSVGAAGLAAALRPELVPWSVALSLLRESPSASERALAVLGSAGPAAIVAAIRVSVFGSPVPLAVWAKPSDLSHGLFYALAAILWTGIPVLVAGFRSLGNTGRDEKAIVAAALVHSLSLVLVGGDWMPCFRLFVPVLPGLLWVGAQIAGSAPTWATIARVTLAMAVSGKLLVDKGNDLRGVMDQRTSLILGARPVLANARRVATLDAGWVGAATATEVVDLAGVTDPAIAVLPGGHTSKRLPPTLLEKRRVDAVVLLMTGPLESPWEGSPWARAAEQRVAKEAAELGFVPQVVLELPRTTLAYVVLVLKNRS